MEEALRALMLGMAPLTALVDRRVNWGARRQGDPTPAVTLNLVVSSPQMNLAGTSVWNKDRVQFDAWGLTHKAARDVANVVAPPGGGGLHGLRTTASNIRFRIWVIDRDSGTDSDGEVIHRTRLDFRVWWAPLVGA